jgi:hypothetical protein
MIKLSNATFPSFKESYQTQASIYLLNLGGDRSAMSCIDEEKLQIHNTGSY